MRMVQQGNDRDCGICAIVSIRRLSAAIAQTRSTALISSDPTVIAAVVNSAGLDRAVPPEARLHVAHCLLQTQLELSCNDPW
jgi:Ulp1 family protease